MKLPPGARIRPVELLRAEIDIPFRVTSETVEFIIPKAVACEVAALCAA